MNVFKRLFWTAVLCVATALGAAPVHAQSASFGSPIIPGPGGGRDFGNVTCYFSNVGRRTIRLENVGMFRVNGANVTIDSNVCGPLAGFDLAPGATCFVGAPVRFQPNGFACRARVVDNARALRGSIETRNRNQVVFESESLTVGPVAPAPDAFRSIASPPLFGAPQQNSARCSFTNVGDADARLKDVRFVRSDGSVAATAFNDCAASGEFTLAPGHTCEAGIVFVGGQVTDIQCRAMTTRSADVRGLLRVLDQDFNVANSRPLD